MTTNAVSHDTIDRILSIIELHGGWARFACQTSVLFLTDLESLGRAMLAMSAKRTLADSEPDPADAAGYCWRGGFITLAEGYRALRAFLDASAGCPASAQTLYQALEGYAGLLAAAIGGEARRA